MNKQSILRKVEHNAKGCWIYPGAGAYPKVNGKWIHHAAYELWIGPIPPGCDLDHTCSGPGYRGRGSRCVNPWHLKPVTRARHQLLTYIRRRGQMPRDQLRIARWLHNEVGRH